ncbi:MAG: DMT family transporter [Bacteroidota bacterium]|nr:DMT family transporter [Bacteroidota bacterium]
MKIDVKTFFILLFLGFVWGSSFILMKKGLIVFSPLQVASLRLVFAGSVGVFFFLREYKKLKQKDWLFLSLSGLLGNFIPAFLFASAGAEMPSSLSGALNAMTPFFALLAGVAIFSQQFKISQGVGILVGLIGSLLLIFSKSKTGFSFYSEYIFPCLKVILAALLYGINVNIIKSKLHHLSAIVNSMVPLTIISVPALFIAIQTNTWQIAQSSEAMGPLLYILILGVLGSAISLIVFNMLVKKSTALFAASVTYLIPIFAYFWGVIDGEPIGWFQVGGMGLILLGITLTRR